MNMKSFAMIAATALLATCAVETQAATLTLSGKGDCAIRKPVGVYQGSRVIFVKHLNEKDIKHDKFAYLNQQPNWNGSYFIQIPKGFSDGLLQLEVGPPNSDEDYMMWCYIVPMTGKDMHITFENPQEKICQCQIS